MMFNNLFALALRRLTAAAQRGGLWVRDRWTGGALFRVSYVDDEPKRPSPRTVYVIRDAGKDWAAVMTCPGGCGQALHMNLILDSKPVWKLTEHPGGTLSLSPSVWRRQGCGCHFWIRYGRIHWC
jgi:hypothetical protein